MRSSWFKLFALSIISALSFFLLISSSAEAQLAGFDSGRLMDDIVMSNKDTMSEAQIQSFLKSKNPCNDADFSKLTGHNESSGWFTWTDSKGVQKTAYYNIKDGHFICMADENFDNESAAHIIWQAAQDYNINPQVLIVLLQKEQGLITDTWPNINYQYAAATGYDCPDNGNGCNNANAGFKNQIRKAAALFRQVLDGGWTNYPVGVNYIQYSPNTSCGGNYVDIKNRATSALYRYTPYQPNAAALAAGWRTASCGAYGNRNFYNYFTDWFGPTYYNNFKSLDTPRWMQVKSNGTQKVSVMTGEKVGDILVAGRQIRLIDKVLIYDKWYLRTEFNYKDGGLYGVLLDDLEEIPYQSITPKWVTFIEDGNRSHPASRTSVGDNLVRGTSVKVVDQITIDGNIYYRTEFNHNNNQDVGIHSRFVTDFTAIPLDGARNFCANSSIDILDPLAGQITGSSSNGIYMINKKTLVNGVWYYQADTDNETLKFFSSSSLDDTCYVPFESPRSMRLNQDVVRFNPFTDAKYDTLYKNTVIALTTKIFIDNEWYYRTAYNTKNNIDAVIPASAFSEL